MINRFRAEVYQSFAQRGDAGLELIDVLTSTPGVESPVALSESPLFRRGFSSVYDVLKQGRLQYDRLRQLLDELQPAAAKRSPDTKSMAWTAQTIRRQRRRRCQTAVVPRKVPPHLIVTS